ncbi:YncE family protein [Paludibacter sp. 221]|uniref:YncE family protein n=1 Tax=Paludibacter sp. 221 TaxID=2302939 RepID=UPI0013D429B7|nr:DUF5074 domain-containing protein [Paludibacter sp. 221]
MHDTDNPAELPDTGNDWGRMFVLCEGLFNYNNSKLACIDYDVHTLYPDFFKEVGKNNRDLGDTANDMKLFNNQLWIVVNISSQIEVIDASTGKSIRQIPMFGEENGTKTARQPRNIVFHQDKAYVCSFDGTVSRIDTKTFEVEATVLCGRNPDGITVANNKLYVSNSGGLDATAGNGLYYDNTVSVIDIESFQHIKKIEVGINPHHIVADSEGDVYVVSRGNNANIKAILHRINSNTDELAESFPDLSAVNLTIHNDTAYMYNFDYEHETYWIKTFDCGSEKVVSEQFISDGTTLKKPFGIYVHPFTGDVFLSDARNYMEDGDVFCFSKEGKLRYTIEQIGLNPNTFVFSDK